MSIENDILSACMLDSDNLFMALERGCTPEWFTSNPKLFKELAKASAKTKWGERNSLAVLQGAGVFNKCPSALEIAENIPSWAFKVEDVSDAIEVLAIEHSRSKLQESLTVSRNRLARGDDPYDVAGGLMALGEEIDVLSGIGEQTTEAMAEEALALDERIAAGEVIGLPFPWASFQSRTFGIPFKAVVPMGGRDGAKKSRLAQFLAHYWIKSGRPILYFAFEDGRERVLSNMASTEGGYDMFTIKRDYVPPEFMPLHRKMLPLVGKLPLYIEDTPCTAEQMATTVAKFDRQARTDGYEGGLQGVVVDGFKDMIHSVGGDENSKVNYMTAYLVRIAKRHNLAVIPISHVNKVDENQWLFKGNITGAGNQFKSARMVMMFQDWLPPKCQAEYGVCEEEIILEASKCSFGTPARVCLKPVLEEGRFEEVHKVGGGE
jgi:hypothetical protein